MNLPPRLNRLLPGIVVAAVSVAACAAALAALQG